MTKKLVKIGMAVMVTLLALVVLWQFRIAVIYVLISVTLAATLRPLVRRLVGRKLVVRLAWILLYLAALGGFGFLLYWIGKTTINETQQLAGTFSANDQWKLPVWMGRGLFQQTLLASLPPPSILLKAITGIKGELVLPTILGLTQGIVGSITTVIVLLLLTLYWIVNQVHFERLWLSLLPSDKRKRARDIWLTIEPDLGAYLRSQIVVSLLAGLLLGLGYWVIGSPYPILLAVLGAIASLIPVVGVVLAAIPPLLLGLLVGAQSGLITVIFTLVVLIALVVWVKPRLFNRRWDNPILTLVILIGFAKAFGLIGIVVAPPISAICQILWYLLVVHRVSSGAAAQLSDLKQRQERVRETIDAMEEPPPEMVTNSMARLELLIKKAEPLLPADLQADNQIDASAKSLPLPEPIISEMDQPDFKKSRKKGKQL
jgi:putative permease